MARNMIRLAAALGALCVALGAFGAHSLQGYLGQFPDAEKRLEWWGKAVDYQMAHTLLLLAIGILASRAPDNIWRRASVAAVFGICFFSGSLYTMTLTGVRWLGAITPIGGIALIIAWILVWVGAARIGELEGASHSNADKSSLP